MIIKLENGNFVNTGNISYAMDTVDKDGKRGKYLNFKGDTPGQFVPLSEVDRIKLRTGIDLNKY